MHITFFIAKRYAQKYNRSLVDKLSRLAGYSTTLGTAILVLVLSTMNGMEHLFASLFYSHAATLKIESKIGKTFIQNSQLKDNISALPGVKYIVEILETITLLRVKERQIIVTLQGVSNNFIKSNFYKKCSRIDATIFTSTPERKPQVLIGMQLSKWLQVHPHDIVEIFYPKLNPLAHPLPHTCKRIALEICGLFSIEPKTERNYIITPINIAERLMAGLNHRSYWEIVLEDAVSITSMQENIQKILPSELKISNEDEQNDPKRKAILIEKLAVYLVFALILLLTALHIFFMLCILVLDKKKDIFLLSALGATPRQIRNIFFYNGLFVSIKGIAYGLMLAWILGAIQQKFGMITLIKLKHTAAIAYPIQMRSSDFIHTALLTVVLGILTSLWPAQQAAKLAKKRILQ